MSSKISLLQDLDEIAAQVRTPAAKSYIGESIACYRSGANRASIVMTWIAICVDFIEKVQELSLSGDEQAKEIEKTYKGAANSSEQNAMAIFERGIITFAEEKLGLISSIEATHLKRIQDDRHVCAHPTFSVDGEQYSPNAEQARLHIVNACNALLIYPPTQGKVLVSKLLARVNKHSFPKNTEDARVYLLDPGYLESAKPTVNRNFLVVLFKQLFGEEDIKPDHRDRLISALSAMSLIDKEAFDEVFAKKATAFLRDAEDESFKRLYWFLSDKPEYWKRMNESARARSKTLVGSLSAEEMVKYNLCQCSVIPDIADLFRDRIGKYDYDARGKVLASANGVHTRDLAIKRFLESESYASAYKNGIDILLPHAPHFGINDLEKILTGSEANESHGYHQILEANGIDKVFSDLCQKTLRLDGAKEMWGNFWNKIINADYNRGHDNLRNLLVSEGIIPPPPEGEKKSGDEEEDAPF